MVLLILKYGLTDYIKITKENKIIKGKELFLGYKKDGEKMEKIKGIYEKEKEIGDKKYEYSMYLIFNNN